MGTIPAVKSELRQLLEKNSSGQGLTEIEYGHVHELLAEPLVTSDDCWLCAMIDSPDTAKSIYDTGLCRDHVFYALSTGK